MRRSDWEDRCRRHPEHRLSKGVCPSCLRDRLAHLSANSSATTTLTRASNSASTSPYSSTDSPPLHHAALSADTTSVHVVGAGAGSSFVNVSAFSQPLMPTTAKKAAAGRQEEAKGKEGEAKKKKKSSSKKKIGRFLSRLVGTEKRRRTGEGDGGELFHSSTMKEKSSTKWVFF
ncbi:hypothetical protein D1007_36380 [Hordeum vulgare]|uniref:Predicted protein n=1 Tax=Hordeum vulgare subsp. vulgare TaxID=112509 RepID=F2D2L5_HORVV|nr:uncharacterized protein LOC123447176 [Hordeum vulgare subsp. vulgare]KAE8789400.1 hypothetical protein D1007_36380 [Hordeum vulgare]BAJ89336.1 predicted protein [Hordeum vulgare subsp. vulgare]